MKSDHLLVLRRSVSRQLDGLAYRRYGWDGKKGLPMRREACSFASFSIWIYVDFDFPAPEPRLYLEPHGGIVAEFIKDGRTLRLGIPCENVMTYHRLWSGGAQVEGVIYWDADLPHDEMVKGPAAQVVAELRWVATGEG